MLETIKKVFRDAFTENAAGTVFCPIRALGAALISTHTGAMLWQLIAHGLFDPVAFGTGSAALLSAFAAAIGIKRKLGSDAP
ncbi:MAG TPA: hypothetical protein VGH23_20475 [Rhizomicrobium sp.]|jgi:hypothetical protein